MSPWNLQENSRCQLFWAFGNNTDAKNSKIALIDLCAFWIARFFCIVRLNFVMRNFVLIKNLAILNARKLQWFQKTLISHRDTLGTLQ